MSRGTRMGRTETCDIFKFPSIPRFHPPQLEEAAENLLWNDSVIFYACLLCFIYMKYIASVRYIYTYIYRVWFTCYKHTTITISISCIPYHCINRINDIRISRTPKLYDLFGWKMLKIQSTFTFGVLWYNVTVRARVLSPETIDSSKFPLSLLRDRVIAAKMSIFFLISKTKFEYLRVWLD